MINGSEKTKMVPAICTQCSAKIEVDASRDAAICQYCGTAFIVEKAIKNFSIQGIQNAHIEHIDTVNINTAAQGNTGRALHFIDKQLDRRTMIKIEKERLKAERENEREKREAEETARLMKYLPLILLFAAIMLIIMLYFTKSK